jgi:DNA-directed RNA polymerase specialized sigma subunit
MSKTMKIENNHYMKFLEELNGGLLNQKDFNVAEELDKLFLLENEFRTILSSTKKGLGVYSAFIKYIVNEERNILAARVFFREREETFSKKIPNIIRSNNAKALAGFSINYKFIYWAINRANVPQKKKADKLFAQIVKVRQRIVEQSIPLIINRSRLYQVRTRKFKDDALEFIQSATEGFLSAIDKYTPPTTSNFNGVAIGWMQAKLMSDGLEGFVKLSVKEKRILYRINLAVYRHGFTDMNRILLFVRESYPKTDKETIEAIMMASTELSSIDNMQSSDLEQEGFMKYTDNEEGIITDDLNNKLYSAISKLPIIQQKVLKLKGGLDG